MNKRDFIKYIPFAGVLFGTGASAKSHTYHILSADEIIDHEKLKEKYLEMANEGQAVGKYDAVMKSFPEGTWVFGVGEHRGCSQTFDYQYPNRPQPFSYLGASDPEDFRFATVSEIMAAKADA